jgi:hypothetical protein
MFDCSAVVFSGKCLGLLKWRRMLSEPFGKNLFFIPGYSESKLYS